MRLLVASDGDEGGSEFMVFQDREKEKKATKERVQRHTKYGGHERYRRKKAKKHVVGKAVALVSLNKNCAYRSFQFYLTPLLPLSPISFKLGVSSYFRQGSIIQTVVHSVTTCSYTNLLLNIFIQPFDKYMQQ
jgi:hypothetical protein